MLALTAEWATFWAQVVYTVITLLIFIAAIWGEGIRRRWAGASLRVRVNDPPGTLASRANGQRVWFFHLNVRNRRPYSAGLASILCVKLEYANEQGTFVPKLLSYPLPLLWAPAEVHGWRRTVGAEAVCDLGHVNEDEGAFVLALGVRPFSVDGKIAKGQIARVHLVAEVDGCPQRDRHVLQITWNGLWSDTAPAMFENLKITEVAPEGT